MQVKHFCLIGLCTHSIFFLNSQVASAFTFTLPSPTPLPCEPGNSYYCAEHTLTLPGADGGVVTTKLKPIIDLTLGGTNSFLELLNNSVWAKNGWQFKPATTNLSGRFDIGVYNAYATLPSVGANIQILYQPGENDPKGGNVHWIQRVVTNHAYQQTLQGDQDLGHGTSENSIDVVQEQTDILFSDPNNPQKQTFNPFYNTYSKFANQTSFEDFTGRPDISENHDWYAELYLVQETAPKTVTIYNGISWGWENTFTPKLPQPSKTFSGTLTSGSQTDQYKLDGLTPGNYFYAWTNNSIPSNRCNPNTYLSATSGTGYNYDNDSSPTGDGFASALSGIVPDNGIIDLFVGTHSGRRGEDRGSYELNVKVYDSEVAPPSIIVGSSGGGGVSRPRPGNTQQNPILPTSNSGSWQIFNNVPSCRWYDPHTTYGFEFQALEDTLFTEILDFPVGLDNRFKVSVGNTYLGEFSPGDRVDFVSLFGQGVSQFKITDIDALIGETVETAFPIQLAFNKSVGSFQMRPFQADETPTPQRVPEPMSVLGLLALSIWCGFQALKISLDSPQLNIFTENPLINTHEVYP